MPDDQTSSLDAINKKFGLGAPTSGLGATLPVPSLAPEPSGALSPLDSINQKFGLKSPGPAAVQEVQATPDFTKHLQDNRHLDFVDRVLKPEKYPTIKNDDGSYSTHLMSSSDDIAYPEIVRKPGEDAVTRLSPQEAREHARKTGEFIKFKTPEEADQFASGGYKTAAEQLRKTTSAAPEGAYPLGAPLRPVPFAPQPVPKEPEVVPGDFGGEVKKPGALPEALAPTRVPEEPLHVRAWNEINRFAAAANKAPVDVFHGLAKGLDDIISYPGRIASGDWESPTPAYASKLTGAVKEAYAPEKMINEAHPVTRFLGELFGGLEAYMMPGGISTKIATKALPEAPLMQKALSNLITFASTDAFQTAGAGGDPEQVRNAFLKALPTSVLFTVAQALPFDKVAKNQWMKKALESTATGTAFAGAHAMGGQTDPGGLATSFLTGFFLHALQGGIPRKEGLTPEERQKALSEYFDKYTVDWKETNQINEKQWGAVKEILDNVKAEKSAFDQPQPEAPTPEAQKEAIFGGALGETIESQPNRADAVRALVPQIGDQARAEQFYDLYQKGDAETALKEFPELASWATEAQKAAQKLPEAPAPEPIPQPMSSAGAATEASAVTELAPAAEAPKKRGAMVAPKPELPDQPMGTAGGARPEVGQTKVEVGPAEEKSVETLPPGVEDFMGKYGTARGAGKPEGLISKAGTLDRALETGNLPAIIRHYGGLDSRSELIKNFEPEEQKLIYLLSRKGEPGARAQGPDELAAELRANHPEEFGHIENGEQLLREIANRNIYKKANLDKLIADVEEGYANLEQKAAEEGFDKEALARAIEDDKASQRAERDAIQREGSAGTYDFEAGWPGTEEALALRAGAPKPTALETRLDSFLVEYPDIDREKAAQVIRAFPNAEDGQIVNMVIDPEMFSQVARGNLAASEKAQLLKKATDAGAQQGLPGMDKPEGDTLFKVGEGAAPRLGEGEPVTLETAKREMGKAGYLVNEAQVGDASGYHITLPSGKMIFVITGKDFQKPALEDIQRTYPDMTRERWDRAKIAGEWQPMSLGGIAYLAKEAGVRTFRHEVGLHGAADLVLTAREMKAVLRDYGDWETAARAYEDYTPGKGPENPIFRKIWEFFQNLMHLIRPTGESTFAKIESGEIWLRKEAGPGTMGVPFAPERYKLSPEEKAADREARKAAGIPTYRDFYKTDLKEGGELYERLKTPGNRDVPLYEGQQYTSRAGLQIKDETGKVRFLSKKEIYEHFYAPQKDYATGTEVPVNPKVEPEGTIEPPPERTVLRSLKEKMAVGTLSEKSDFALGTVIEHTAWSAREAEKTFATLNKYEPVLKDMDQDTFLKYMDIAEKGELNAALERGEVSPEFVQAMQAWRRISDGFHYLWSYEAESKAEAKIAEGKKVRPEDAQVAYWTDYYARNFENPEMAGAVIANAVAQSRKPGGPAGFRKPRTELLMSNSIKPKLEIQENGGQFDVVQKSLYGDPDAIIATTADRAKAQEIVDTQGGLGLRLVDQNNYVNVMKANVWEKLRWFQDTYMVNDQSEAGFLSRKKQPGWVALPDKGLTKGFYAHPDVAKVWDKYLSIGMRSDPLFKAYYSPFTMMQEVFVGFSAFHASFSTLSYLSHGVGMNLPRAIGAALSGDFTRAGKHLGNIGRTFNLPGEFALSRRLAEEYRHPGTHPDLAPYVDLLTAGGIRIQDNGMLEMGRSWKENREQMTQSFVDVWKDNKIGIPRWMVKKMAAPIMNYVVPSFKIVAQFRRLEMELDTATREKGSPLTREEQVKIARETASESDNIYGQMVYDNIGMTRGMKDMLSLMIGFPGWNIGSFTKMAYTGKGLLHLARESARAGGELITGNKPTWEKMDRNSRMGVEFYTGMVLVMAVGGAILQRLLSGEWPTSTKDLFMPRTGNLLPNGQPERMRLPTYMRDVLSLQHPVEMVKHKLPFPMRLFNELVDNKNYFGEQIRDPWSPATEQAQDTAKYLATSMMPFGIQGMQKTQSPKGKYLNIIGITPMPRTYTNTPAQNVIDEYNQMMRASMTTKGAAELKTLKSDLMKLARDQDEAGFKEATDAAVSEGKITRQQVKEIVAESQAPPGMSRFTRLPLEWAVRAWGQASDYEKEQWQPYFLKKVMAEKPENLIKNRDAVVETLTDMGLTEAADAVTNLTMPEETGVDLTGMGLLKPAPEMSGMEAVDAAIAAGLETKLEPKTKRASAMVRPPSLREKKKPFGVLGL